MSPKSNAQPSVSVEAPAGQRIVGIDIGGANLKYAGNAGHCFCRPFPMWKRSRELSQQLYEDLGQIGTFDTVAVTMTGELADCFPDRDFGVRFIVDRTLDAFKRIKDASNVASSLKFYGVDGRFHSPEEAKRRSERIAAANWHALAQFVAREVCDHALLVDIGSTTTDLIPIRDGSIATNATSDYERLVEGSLVYIGCRRTPVCALVDSLRYQSEICPVMNEVFATIDDARVLLGHEEPDQQDCDTADGEPRSLARAANRMARMIGLDQNTLTIEAATELSRQVLSAARTRIEFARRRLVDHETGSTIVISGHGQDLLSADDSHKIELADRFGPTLARCAPSYAVALNCQHALRTDPS